MEGEEPRARDEGKGDEEEPGVVEPPRRLSGEEPQRDADQGCHEDEPEVGRVVLPVDVGRRRGKQEREADERAVAPVEPAAALDALLYGVALLVLIGGAAAGSTVFALSGCLAVFGLQTMLGAGVELRRPAVLEQR